MASRIEPAVSREWITNASVDELEVALVAYETQAEIAREPWKRERAAVTAGVLEAELWARTRQLAMAEG